MCCRHVGREERTLHGQVGIYSWAECQRRGLHHRARLALELLEALLLQSHGSFAALAFIASSPSIASALEFYLVFIEVRIRIDSIVLACTPTLYST